MLYYILLFIFTGLFSYLFTLTGLSLWFLFLWVPLSFISSIIILALLTLLFLAIGTLTKPTGPFRHFILRNMCYVGLSLYRIKVVTVNRENLPKETFVIYANHKSNYDPVIIYYAAKKACSAVGKKELFKNPFMKIVATAYGAVPMDREDDREAVKSMMIAIKQVKQGLSMIIFPEGGIKSRETELMVDLKPGAYKLATKPGAPIVPVTIIGSSQISKKKFFQRKVVKVVFHKPIYKAEYENLNTTEIGKKVEEIINGEITNEKN